jgi:hypothetical protein
MNPNVPQIVRDVCGRGPFMKTPLRIQPLRTILYGTMSNKEIKVL